METLQERLARLELELAAEKKKNEIIQKDANCAIWEYDIASKRLSHARKLDGKYSDTNMVIEDYRKTMHGWNLVHPEDWDVFDAYCDSMDQGDASFRYDLRQITDESMFVWLRYEGETIYDSYHRPVKVIGKTLNVTAEKQNAEQLFQMAQRDSLTELYNKEATRTNIQKYIYNPESRKLGGGFLIVDVDDFKNVNDTCGHLYGDYVLKQVASILTRASAKGDIVGRIGGDEFCLFCKEKQTREALGEVAQFILDKAGAVSMRENLKLGLSIGIAMFPLDASEYELLYDYADNALYKSKTEGKGKYEFYESGYEYQQMQPVKERRSGEKKAKEKSSGEKRTLPQDKVNVSLLKRVLEGNHLAYYLVQKDTFQLLEVSPKINYVFPQYAERSLCYEALQGRTTPCPDCPILTKAAEESAFSHMELYRAMEGKGYEVTVQTLNLAHGAVGKLISWTDLSHLAKRLGKLDSLTGALDYSEFWKEADKLSGEPKSQKAIALLGWNGLDLKNREGMIKDIASFLQRSLEDGELLCRFEEATFLLLLSEEKQDAKGRMERLIQTFEALLSERNARSGLKGYAGVVLLSDRNQNQEKVLRLAQVAKENARASMESGKNVCVMNDK